MYQVLDVRLLKIPGTVEELAPLAREYGFDGLDVPEAILGDEKKADSAQAAMKENGLKWGLLPTPVDFFDETIDEKKFEEALEIQKRWAQLGEKIGVKYAYNHIWPSSSREFDENFEWHVKRLEKLEEIASSFAGVDKSYAIQAGREIRVMVKPEQVSEDEMVILARELAKRIESELEYPGQIKVHVLRETKVVEYAK